MRWFVIRSTAPDADCAMLEINPLVVTQEGQILALDAKMNFDDNALFRHPDQKEMLDPTEVDPVEAEAADGAVRNRTWRSADPFNEVMLAERVRWQLQAWLDTARLRSGPGIRGGLIRLRIMPADLSQSASSRLIWRAIRSAIIAEPS